VQEQQKVYMAVLIEKLNDLLRSESSEQDQLRYVNGTILGKMAESATLLQQSANSTKVQFANSPNLQIELQNAIIDSLDAHTSMSITALNSPVVMDGLVDIFLNHSGLYERLQEKWLRNRRAWASPASNGGRGIKIPAQAAGNTPIVIQKRRQHRILNAGKSHQAAAGAGKLPVLHGLNDGIELAGLKNCFESIHHRRVKLLAGSFFNFLHGLLWRPRRFVGALADESIKHVNHADDARDQMELG
jgi:type I restriction enzyme R subunit